MHEIYDLICCYMKTKAIRPYFQDGKLYKILHDVKTCIMDYCTPLHFFIIGSNKNKIISKSDLDIVIVVKDDMDLVILTQMIAPSINSLILKYKIFISVFPIKEQFYLLRNTQFICNVVNQGIEF